MRHALTLHPESRCQAVTRIEVEPRRTAAGLAVRFVVTGAIENLVLPKWAKSLRADDLWKHTCFEAFARGVGSEAYCEFNFSPSTEWAAYRFSKYRREDAMDIGEVDTPVIVLRDSASHFQMDVAIDLSRVAELPRRAAWRAGVAAVIEEKGGQKSYWALAHPQGKPDFHHADGFVLQLPPAEQR